MEEKERDRIGLFMMALLLLLGRLILGIFTIKYLRI
jgi:hypothetical protein